MIWLSVYRDFFIQFPFRKTLCLIIAVLLGGTGRPVDRLVILYVNNELRRCLPQSFVKSGNKRLHDRFQITVRRSIHHRHVAGPFFSLGKIDFAHSGIHSTGVGDKTLPFLSKATP